MRYFFFRLPDSASDPPGLWPGPETHQRKKTQIINAKRSKLPRAKGTWARTDHNRKMNDFGWATKAASKSPPPVYVAAPNAKSTMFPLCFSQQIPLNTHGNSTNSAKITLFSLSPRAPSQ